MYCGQFATGAGRQIQDTYASSGQVRFEYKNYAFLGEASTLAAEAALCAEDQEQFWPYHDMLFVNASTLFVLGADARPGLRQVARALGLNTTAFNTCFNSREHRQDVQQALADGRAKGVSVTPTVYINGVRVETLTFDALRQTIEEELAKTGP